MTACNYSVIAYLHILQITAANSTSPVFNLFLVTASKSSDSSASALTPFPTDRRLTTELPTQLPLSLACADQAETPSFLCSVRIRCRENVFTEPFTRNWSGISAHLAVIA
jgi:hypothetical protein